MVKADLKRDYYADLELPATADADEIKRQFRTLAKQYHPDRNPGREVEVVAKFQAVQAAHEILSDPVQKAKYDADRAKISKPNNLRPTNDTDPYNFRKPANKAPPPPSAFPPPPRRATTGLNPDSFQRPNLRSRAAPAATGAEKFNVFTRTPQQWDRARFDAATQADAVRGFQSMRGGPSTPQVPPRPPRAPTAAKPYDWSGASPPEGSAPPAGFHAHPGVSRTASTRTYGFDPGARGDEPMAQRTSAYAATYGRDRTVPSAYPHHPPPTSPPMTAQEPAVSPLRHVRSSGFGETRPLRPGLDRYSTKYATQTGERTDVGGGIGRSASVRTSPVEPKWSDHDREPLNRPYSHHGAVPPRHHSASPKPQRTDVNGYDYSSSESESSSADDLPTMRERTKAQPRKARPAAADATPKARYKSSSGDEPAFTGHFPSTNYTRIIGDDASSPYEYPAPDDHDVPVRRPFADMPIPEHGPFVPAEKESGAQGPQMNNGHPKYVPSSSFGTPAALNPRPATPRSQIPAWAVPSSVMPHHVSAKKRQHSGTGPNGVHSRSYNWQSHPNPSINPALFGGTLAADRMPTSGSGPPLDRSYARHAPDADNVSRETINKIFSDSDWDGKFSGDEFIRPTDGPVRDRTKSPLKNVRTRAKSTGNFKKASEEAKEATTAGDESLPGVSDSAQSFHTANQGPEEPKRPVFQPGTFSAEQWAEKLRDQKWSIPTSELPSSQARTPKQTRPRHTPRPAVEVLTGDRLFQTKSQDADSEPTPSDETPGSYDAMDIDVNSNGTTPQPSVPPAPPAIHMQPPTPHEPRNGAAHGVSLKALAHTAPLAPSATGIHDLHDLTTTLPFESKAASTIPPLDAEGDLSHVTHFVRPRPPRPIEAPPIERITQEIWEQYVDDLNAYLHDWNVYNVKMLDHFRARQDQVQLGMGKNWISAQGDGPSASEFDAMNRDGTCGVGLGKKAAGFATYMAWLEEDAKCRVAWDVANERHRRCFEDVARVRARVKGLSGYS